MPVIVLTSAVYEPIDSDMLYFRIEGTCDGEPFASKIALEIDGRDAEFDWEASSSIKTARKSHRCEKGVGVYKIVRLYKDQGRRNRTFLVGLT